MQTVAVVYLAAGLCSAGPLQAGTLAYSLTLCEDLSVLQNPSDMTTAKMAAWQTQHALLVARNMPYLELKNLSDTASITNLSLTIGDTSNNFDFVSLIEASSGVTFTPVSIDTMPGGLRSDVMQISFSGLGPGKSVRFRTDLDKDVGDALVDYRMVLFDMNGASEGDNAVATLTFNDPAIGTETLSKPLPDFAVTMPTHTGLAFRASYGMDHVRPFTDGDAISQQIPEPAGYRLMAFGLLSFAVWAWRQRQA